MADHDDIDAQGRLNESINRKIESMDAAAADKRCMASSCDGGTFHVFYHGPRCATCRFYAGLYGVMKNGDPDEVSHGECRRYPPILDPSRVEGYEPLEETTSWIVPCVDPHDGCGEHQPRSA
jgi:hypothetical protein